MVEFLEYILKAMTFYQVQLKLDLSTSMTPQGRKNFYYIILGMKAFAEKKLREEKSRKKKKLKEKPSVLHFNNIL